MAHNQLPNAVLLKTTSIISVLVAGFLFLIKVYAFEITGALSILAGLMDSFLDIAASLVNFFALRYALYPADKEHRFGHGKAEALAGLMQATLITTSVILLTIESVMRIINPLPIVESNIGILVTVISIIFTGGLVLFQNYVVKKTGSLAIKADSLHYKSDFLLNAVILISLVLTTYFNVYQIDSVFSIIIAIVILWGVKGIVTQSINQILDREIPDEERHKLYQLAVSHSKVHEIHDLRTRMSGNGVFMQFHMELPPETLLLEAHNISEEVEDYIKKNYNAPIEVFIHVDPLGHPRENPENFTQNPNNSMT